MQVSGPKYHVQEWVPKGLKRNPIHIKDILLDSCIDCDELSHTNYLLACGFALSRSGILINIFFGCYILVYLDALNLSPYEVY
jgi:hypothetical protein